jgi:hypothetical protein
LPRGGKRQIARNAGAAAGGSEERIASLVLSHRMARHLVHRPRRKPFSMAYVYFEPEPGKRAAANLMTKDEARKIANGIVKLPELLRPSENKSPLYAARLNGGRIGGWGLGQRLSVTSNNSDTGYLVPEKLAECEAFPPSLGARPALRRPPVPTGMR